MMSVTGCCPGSHADRPARCRGEKHRSCFCATACPRLADCGEDDSIMMALNGFELPTLLLAAAHKWCYAL